MAVQATAFGNRTYPHRWNFVWKTAAAGFEPKENKVGDLFAYGTHNPGGPQISGVTYFTTAHIHTTGVSFYISYVFQFKPLSVFS